MAKKKQAKKQKFKVSLVELSSFARQFVTMFDSGVPIHQALEFYADGDPNDLGEVIREVGKKVATGTSMSHAMSQFPKIFSPVFIGLVAAGERTGELSTMLHNLTNLLEEEARISNKVKSALTYPFFLMLVSFSVACVFMYVIMPALEPMLQGMGVTPPWPTQVLIFFGQFLRHPLTITGAPTLVFLLWWKGGDLMDLARAHPVMGEKLDWLPIQIPVVGNVYRRITLARVLFTMSTTIEAGISLTSALQMAYSVTSNRFFQRAIDKTRAGIADGETLAESMSKADGMFPDGLVQMISVGEETACLSSVLTKTAEMYSEDCQNRIDTAVQLLEPIMLFGMGMVSGFLVMAAMLPIVKMIESL